MEFQVCSSHTLMRQEDNIIYTKMMLSRMISITVEHHDYRHDISKLNDGFFLCLPCFEQLVGANKPKISNSKS